VVVLGGFAVAGLYVYEHVIQDGIDADAREAQAFAVRAAERHESFIQAAREMESRLSRPGIRIVAVGHPPHDAVHRTGPSTTSVPMLIRQAPPRPPSLDVGPLAAHGAPPGAGFKVPVVEDGRVSYVDPRSVRFQGSRIGFALGTALGAHFLRIEFDAGELRIAPDPDATQRVALWLLVGVLLVGALAGFLAWLAGRYITTQVLRPLIEVTHALQRFAARDFTPQPIAVAGKSEFDAIALAYNAAAMQVASAFAERRRRRRRCASSSPTPATSAHAADDRAGLHRPAATQGRRRRRAFAQDLLVDLRRRRADAHAHRQPRAARQDGGCGRASTRAVRSARVDRRDRRKPAGSSIPACA